MTMSGIGDLAQRLVLRNEMTALKQAARTVGTEVATGRTVDPSTHLRGQLGPLAAIEASLSRITALERTAALAGVRTGAQQAALDMIGASAADLQTVLLQAVAGGGPSLTAAAADDAAERFKGAISALGGRAGDRTLFAGVESQDAAMAPADDILSSLRAAVASSTTAAEAEAAVADWFARPDGYDSVAYRGGAAVADGNADGSEGTRLSLTAADPAIKETLEALALAAVMSGGGGPQAPGERQELARRSAERLAADAPGRAALQGRLGGAEAAIDTARTRLAAEAGALRLPREDLIGVDEYEAATRLEATQTQLETHYAVTARLARLSLVDFLR